jgi:hypothetical protein
MWRPAVKKRIAQYLNEIVSITIMLLMAIALIAGQATPLVTGAESASDRVAYQAVRAAGDE